MDIKAKIEEIVEKVKSDKDFAAKFKADPIKAVESVLGIDLPDDKIKEVIDGVKTKVKLDEIGDKFEGIADKIGGLFGKD